MSEQEDISDVTASQLLSAEYKDGELQIVEVKPYDKSDEALSEEISHSMPELELDGETKYVQLVNASDKSLMHPDLLVFSLVRNQDGSDSYSLVANEEGTSQESAETFTCVLASSDNEDSEIQETLVMVEGDQNPLVYLQTPPQTSSEEIPTVNGATTATNKILTMTPEQMLARAKMIKKTRAMLNLKQTEKRKETRGRKRKSVFPAPHELLASPNFKLFLYSCQMCAFKCNAVKEMTAHRNNEHGGGKAKWRSNGRFSTGNLQCARCPYKGSTHTQLMKHVQDSHSDNKVYLNTDEVAAADVLVCGACGYESASRHSFKEHIENEHGATTC